MNKIEVCDKVKKVIRHIVIDNGIKILSAGTGVIVKDDGKLLGIICEKALTKSKIQGIPELPSGTGMGLSHQLISWLLPKI